MARERIVNSDILVTKLTHPVDLVGEIPAMVGFGAEISGRWEIEPAMVVATPNAREALRMVTVDMLDTQRAENRHPVRFYRPTRTLAEAEEIAAQINNRERQVSGQWRPRSWRKPTIGDYQRNDSMHRSRY